MPRSQCSRPSAVRLAHSPLVDPSHSTCLSCITTFDVQQNPTYSIPCAVDNFSCIACRADMPSTPIEEANADRKHIVCVCPEAGQIYRPCMRLVSVAWSPRGLRTNVFLRILDQHHFRTGLQTCPPGIVIPKHDCLRLTEASNLLHQAYILFPKISYKTQ